MLLREKNKKTHFNHSLVSQKCFHLRLLINLISLFPKVRLSSIPNRLDFEM